MTATVIFIRISYFLKSLGTYIFISKMYTLCEDKYYVNICHYYICSCIFYVRLDYAKCITIFNAKYNVPVKKFKISTVIIIFYYYCF